jgi:hypothetical protein
MQRYLLTLALLPKAKRHNAEHVLLLRPKLTSKLLLFELEEITVLRG